MTASAAHVDKGRKLDAAGDLQGALAEFLHAAEIDPSNEAAQQEIARVRQRQGVSAPKPETGMPGASAAELELETVQAPAALKPLTNEPLSLHMAEDAKTVYLAIGKAAGINVLFDPDFNAKRVQVDLNNVSLLDALRIVGVMSNTFWRPVTSNTIFIAQNSRTKRQELEEEAVQTFYLTNAWQQNDLNDVQTALRNVMPNAKVYGVQSQNAIVMRGTPDELLLAQQLIDNLDKPRGEVVVDIAVLEVSKNWEQHARHLVAHELRGQPAAELRVLGQLQHLDQLIEQFIDAARETTPTLYTMAHLNSTDFAMSVGSATLNLLLTDNNTKVLQSPRIRATDAQKATMKIGSRIPIATGSYQTGAATALVSSLVNTQFQYQDVGVNIEMTPSIHYDHDVTLKIKIEVSAESGTETISGVTEPIISQRVVDQIIRLREGEASILGGIQNKQEENNWTGIPGLSSIPILKYIFGSKDHTIQDDDIVFVVVPHIVRSQELDQDNLRVIDTGEGQSIDLRHTDQGTRPRRRPARRGKASRAGAAGGGHGARRRARLRQRPRCCSKCAPSTASAWKSRQPAAQAAVPPPSPPASTPAGCAAAAPHAAGASFALNAPAAPLAAGSSFQVPVVLNGGADIASVAAAVALRSGETHAGQRGGGGLPEPRRAGGLADPSRRTAGKSDDRRLASARNRWRERRGRGLRAHLPGQGRRHERSDHHARLSGGQRAAAVAGGRARKPALW